MNWLEHSICISLFPDKVESKFEDCDYPLIAGDGFCDDEANNHECDFDDGDCCGTSDSTVNTNNCLQCMCFGILKVGIKFKNFQTKISKKWTKIEIIPLF